MKYLLLLGNITFHHFAQEELELFNTDEEQKALIHETFSIQLYDDQERAYVNGDDAESYVLFPDFEGELIFENDADRLQAIKDIASLIPIEDIGNYSKSLAMALKTEVFEIGEEVYFQAYKVHEPRLSKIVKKGTLSELGRMQLDPNDTRIFYELVSDECPTITTARSMYKKKPTYNKWDFIK